jgi:hypothetical protein
MIASDGNFAYRFLQRGTSHASCRVCGHKLSKHALRCFHSGCRCMRSRQEEVDEVVDELQADEVEAILMQKSPPEVRSERQWWGHPTRFA